MHKQPDPKLKGSDMKKRILFALIFLFPLQIFAWKEKSLSPKARDIPDSITQAVMKRPKEKLSLLVSTLISGITDDEEKVKVLHDWICDNISFDTKMYFSGQTKKQDFVSVLKNKSALSQGYSALFYEMCKAAGIESVVIHGYSKGFGYLGALMSKTDHDWNAVKAGGVWKLVDVTWDAGRVDFKTWIKSYSSEWFFLAPEYFIYSHLPEKDEYQFLEKTQIRTREQFVKEPFVPARFFELGLRLTEKSPDYKNKISSSVKFDFSLTDRDIILMAEIESKKDGSYVPCATWITRSNEKVCAEYDVPDSEKYKGILFAKKKGVSAISKVFSAEEFEKETVSEVKKLLSDKKITQKEHDFFFSSYFKVDENNRYYLNDDSLDNERNDALKKIFSFFDTDGTDFEPVITFELEAEEQYRGFGAKKARYPLAHLSYSLSTNTSPVAPLSGSIKKGSKIKFSVKSSDYDKFAVKISGNLLKMEKNSSTGFFEFESTIENSDSVTIFASKDSNSYFGLWSYSVE